MDFKILPGKVQKFFKKILRKNALSYADILGEKQNIAYADAIKDRQKIEEDLIAIEDAIKQRQLDADCVPQCKKRILWN